jgi:polysaccharide biosynthesis protein PslH
MIKILFLTTVLPRRQRMGGEVASQCFIDALQSTGCDVTIMGYQHQDDFLELSPSEVTIGRRYIETQKAKFHVLIWLALAFIKRLPYSSAKYYSQDYIEAVQNALKTKQYDRVIVDHAQMAWLTRYIPDPSQLLTISHNIEHQLYFDTARQAKNSLERWIYRRDAKLLYHLEHHLAKVSQQIWTLTQHDAQYFTQQSHGAAVRCFDLPPRLASVPPCPSTKVFDIGIIGSWGWKPNLEGLQWFLDQIYPQLPKDLSIHVAGRGADWLADKYPKIQYHGFVPDAQEFMAQAKVIAIPTLTGGGIQIKTLHAIASGSSIVATAVALRGIVDPPNTVQVATDAEAFISGLASATSADVTESNLKSAFEWVQQREKRFLNDVHQAIVVDNSSSSVLLHK